MAKSIALPPVRLATARFQQVLAGLLLAVGCRKPAADQAGQSGEAPSSYTLTVESCQSCHQAIVASYLGTAHYRTSAPADSTTIQGSFDPGHNTLRTGKRSLAFRMEAKDGGFFQTAVDIVRMSTRTEPMELVIGSGRKGQSYLYWRNQVLLQLPVSHITQPGSWMNSPGYPDGEADFDRVIPPRCLECHATSFTIEGPKGQEYYSAEYLLHLTCEKCHGDARAHVAKFTANPTDTGSRLIANPANFSRDRKLDNCGLCHAGPAKWTKIPFSFRPGDKLSDFYEPEPGSQNDVPDVHGNQVALLAKSKCFRSTPTMSCSTCHDVHQVERDLTAMGKKCLQCHQPAQHKPVGVEGDGLVGKCVDCHMPNPPSKGLQFNTPEGQFAPNYRSHLIAVQPAK